MTWSSNSMLEPRAISRKRMRPIGRGSAGVRLDEKRHDEVNRDKERAGPMSPKTHASQNASAHLALFWQ
jgi:hypothetical protein